MNTILFTIAVLFVGMNVYTFFRHKTYRQTGFDGRFFSHLFVSLCGVVSCSGLPASTIHCHSMASSSSRRLNR